MLSSMHLIFEALIINFLLVFKRLEDDIYLGSWSLKNIILKCF